MQRVAIDKNSPALGQTRAPPGETCICSDFLRFWRSFLRSKRNRQDSFWARLRTTFTKRYESKRNKPQFLTLEARIAAEGCFGHAKIAISPQFLTIFTFFGHLSDSRMKQNVSYGSFGHAKNALFPQFLTLEARIAAEGCSGTQKNAKKNHQFLTLDPRFPWAGLRRAGKTRTLDPRFPWEVHTVFATTALKKEKKEEARERERERERKRKRKRKRKRERERERAKERAREERRKKERERERGWWRWWWCWWWWWWCWWWWWWWDDDDADMMKMIKKRIPKEIFERNPSQTLSGRKERRPRERERRREERVKKERKREDDEDDEDDDDGDDDDDIRWYDMIRYDLIWYDLIWYDTIWYDEYDIKKRIPKDIFKRNPSQTLSGIKTVISKNLARKESQLEPVRRHSIFHVELNPYVFSPTRNETTAIIGDCQSLCWAIFESVSCIVSH